MMCLAILALTIKLKVIHFMGFPPMLFFHFFSNSVYREKYFKKCSTNKNKKFLAKLMHFDVTFVLAVYYCRVWIMLQMQFISTVKENNLKCMKTEKPVLIV